MRNVAGAAAAQAVATMGIGCWQRRFGELAHPSSSPQRGDAVISHVTPPGLTKRRYAEIRKALSKPMQDLTDTDWEALRDGMRIMIVALERWWYRHQDDAEVR